jgi:hypothetical protein
MFFGGFSISFSWFDREFFFRLSTLRDRLPTPEPASASKLSE